VKLSGVLRRCLPVALVAAALAVAACGTPSPDLFAVKRSGTLPGERATLIFDDGGQVRCNGGPRKSVTSHDLIDGRDIVRKLKDAAKSHLRLPAKPGSVTSFAVTFQMGTIHFADNSTPPKKFAPDIAKVQALVRRVATGVCGLPR
jgi:hypothetical protein